MGRNYREIKGDAAFWERRRAGVILVQSTPTKYTNYSNVSHGSQSSKEACPCTDSNRDLTLSRSVALSIELQGHADFIVACGALRFQSRLFVKFPSFFKVVMMDKRRIMSPLLPGSNPGQPTANRLGSLAQQRGGEALTLEKREKATGWQPGETGK